MRKFNDGVQKLKGNKCSDLVNACLNSRKCILIDCRQLWCTGYPHDPVNESCADLECRTVCFPGSSDEFQDRTGEEWVLGEVAEACKIKWTRPMEVQHIAVSCGHPRKGPQNNWDLSFHPRVSVRAVLPEIFTPWHYFVPRKSLPPSVCLSPWIPEKESSLPMTSSVFFTLISKKPDF